MEGGEIQEEKIERMKKWMEFSVLNGLTVPPTLPFGVDGKGGKGKEKKRKEERKEGLVQG